MVRIRRIKNKISKSIDALMRKNKTIESMRSKMVQRRRQRLFDRFKDLETDPKLMVFESFMGRKYADSPRAVYEYLLSHDEYSDFRFIWFLRGKGKKQNEHIANNPRTKVVVWGTESYYEAYAKSKYWFANTRIREEIRKKDDQVYVQCWHGTPLKKLGCDIIADSEFETSTARRVIHNDVKRYSYFVSPSKYYSEHMASALDMAALGKLDTIIETGYPRNDAIVNHTAEDILRVKEKLGIGADKKVILYAPTYRENMKLPATGYVHREDLDIESFLNNIDDKYIILFRAHYYIYNKENIDFEKLKDRIIDVSEYSDINDLFIVSDLLITDYSSVFFDYALLKRPILFYMYDVDYYKDTLRGLYLDLSELPGPIIKTQNDLEEHINTLADWAETDNYKSSMMKFNERFNYLEDGKSSERVIKKVTEGDKR